MSEATENTNQTTNPTPIAEFDIFELVDRTATSTHELHQLEDGAA